MRARAYGRDHVCRRGLATARLLLAVCTAHALVQQSHGAECTVNGGTYYTKYGADHLKSFITQQECEDVYFSDECVANLQLDVGLTRTKWRTRVTDINSKPKGCYQSGLGAFQELSYNTGTRVFTKKFNAVISILKRGT